jgi:hypothetical protein
MKTEKDHGIEIPCGDYTFCVWEEDRVIRLRWWDDSSNKWAHQPLLIDTPLAAELLRLAASYADVMRLKR